MATLEASLRLNDQFTSTLRKIDSALKSTVQTMDTVRQKVNGPAHAFQQLASKAAQAVAQMNSKISSGMSQVFDKMASSNNKIISLFGNFGNRISSSINFSGLMSKVSSFGSGVGSALSKGVNAVKNFGSNMGNAFKQAGNAFKQFKNDLQNGFSQIKGSAEKSQNIFKSMLAATGVAKIAGAAINTIKGSMDSAISRFDTMSKYPKVMQALGYSADQSKASINKLGDGIDGLPTKLDDIVSVNQRIVSVSGNIEKATDTTLALNNAFLASGADADKAARGTEQYIKMMSLGKADLVSWQTLMETMPVSLNKVANAMGYTGESAQMDLYKALNDGTITFAQFQDKLIELGTGMGELANLAKINSLGIATSFGNLKNAVGKGLGNMLTELDRISQKLTGKSIAQHIDGMKGMINNAFNSINANMEGFIQKLLPYFEVIKNAIDKLKEPFGKAFDAIKKSLSDMFSGFGDSGVEKFQAVMDKIVSIFTKLAGFVEKHSDSIVKLGAMLLKLKLALTGFKIAKGIASPLLDFGKGIGTIVGSTGKLIKNLSKIGKSKPNSPTAPNTTVPDSSGPITNSGNAAGQAATKFLKLGAAVLMVGAGIALAAVGFYVLAKAAMQLADSGGAAIAVFFGMIAGIAALVAVVGLLGTSLTAGAVGMVAFGAMVVMVAAGMYLMVRAATQLASAGNVAIAIFFGMFVAIGLLAAVFALLGPLLTAGVIGILAFGAAMLMVGAGIGLAAPGLQVLPPVILAIGVAFAIASNAVANAVSTISGAIASLVSSIANGLSQVISTIGTSISQIITSVGSLVESIGTSISTVVETISNGLTQAIEAVSNGITNVIDSIGGAISGVLDSVAGIFDSIGNAALNAGTGLEKMASAFERIASMGVIDLGKTVGAVGKALKDLSKYGAEMEQVGQAMRTLSSSLSSISSSATSLSLVSTAIIAMSAAMAVTNQHFQAFSTVISAIGLSVNSAVVPLLLLATTSAQVSNALIASTVGMAIFNVQTTMLGSLLTSTAMSMMLLGIAASLVASQLMLINSSLMALSVGIALCASLFQSSTSQMIASVSSLSSQIVSVISSGMSSFVMAITAGMMQAISAVQAGAQGMVSAVRSLYSQMFSAGSYAMQGLAGGIQAGAGSAIAAATAVANQVSAAVKSAMDIHSPSRVMMALGNFVTQGLAKGILAAESLVVSASNAIANAAVPDAWDTSVNGEMQIDSEDVARLKASTSQQVVVNQKTLQPAVTVNVSGTDGDFDEERLADVVADRIMDLVETV